MNSSVLQHRLASRLDELGPLAQAVAAWCAQQGLADTEAGRLNLLLDELITNTVLHGYRGRPDGWIMLRLQRDTDLLHVDLRDGAPHFDPTRLQPPTHRDGDDLAARPAGGLGVDFVRRLVLRWQHEALPEGNRVQLWRRIGAAPRGARA